MTGMVAMWLACLGYWHDISWFGKQWRAAGYVSNFEPIAHRLKSNWPDQGGDRDEIGPFLTYPTNHPTSLVLTSCPIMPNGSPSFNGVERTPDKGIAFPMVGTDGGDWLEWHPADRKPSSYVTGLGQNLSLLRSAVLKDGWYLVRYLPSHE